MLNFDGRQLAEGDESGAEECFHVLRASISLTHFTVQVAISVGKEWERNSDSFPFSSSSKFPLFESDGFGWRHAECHSAPLSSLLEKNDCGIGCAVAARPLLCLGNEADLYQTRFFVPSQIQSGAKRLPKV